MPDRQDQTNRNIYVPANLRAYVFQEQDNLEWETTVIAFRIDPEFDHWPKPILLDSTDADAADVHVFVKDQEQWTEIGNRSCDNLDHARDSVRRTIKDRSERRARQQT